LIWRLDVKFSASLKREPAPNPEQLFAAGWSDIFHREMGVVARRMKVTLPTDVAVDAEIDLAMPRDVYFLGHGLTSESRVGARSAHGHCDATHGET